MEGYDQMKSVGMERSLNGKKEENLLTFDHCQSQEENDPVNSILGKTKSAFIF